VSISIRQILRQVVI